MNCYRRMLLVAGVSVAGAVMSVTPTWAAAGDPILLDTGASFQTSTGKATGGLFDVNPQSGTQKAISPMSTSPGTDYLNGNNPKGVAVGSDGYILVSQQNGFARNRGGVIGIDPSTGEQWVVSSERSMVNPMGIAIDPSQDPANSITSAGNVIVSDTGANAVVRLNPVTNVQSLVAPAGSPLVEVRGVAVAQDGTIFVADHGRPGVEILDPGAPAFEVMHGGSPFESPEGVAVSLDQQSIYVVDPNANAVFQIQRSNGTVSTVYKGSPFNHPLGIATDTDGTLLIADQGAKTVWRLNPQVTPVQTPTPVSSGGSFVTLQAIAIPLVNPSTPTGQFTATQAARGSTSFPPLCSTVTYTVPAGVNQIQYQLVGESGGHGGESGGGDGGFAAMVTGTLAVTQGQTLYINLGDNNSHGDGAGDGGDGGDMSYITAVPGTNVPTGDSCTQPAQGQTGYLAIAAGGGGGSGNIAGGSDGGNGGDAGQQGDIGEDCTACGAVGHGGFPGTQTAGGAAGGEYATGGSFLKGGNGGGGSDGDISYGGGGSGGLYGAGGGSGGNSGSGGGGGSSYVNTTAASGPTTVSWSRSRLQAPTIIITPVLADLGNGNGKGNSRVDPQPDHGNDHRPKPPH